MPDLEKFVKNVMYGGIGAAASLVEKGGDLARSLVEKGQETVRNSQDTADDIKRRLQEFCDGLMNRGEIDISKLTPEQRAELRHQLEEMDYQEIWNVIALGVGISTGLGYGDNARAALITRGIAEIARLGVAMGCNIHTFAGLAGIGDLIVTATSMHSRNNRAGILIGKGETPEHAVKEVGMVVEGMNALPAALELAERYQVEMPIVQTVNAIVNKGMSAAEAVKSLMERGLKNELPQEYEK